MAIELYYTRESETSPRNWHDPNVSCRGSLATWMCFMYFMEEKYLPSLPYPADFPPSLKKDYRSRFSAAMMYKGEGEHPMQEVWDLQLSPATTHAERLTMQSMMDRCYFLSKDFPEIAHAWSEVANEMGGEGAVDAFSELIRKINKLIQDIPDIHSIGINWNSVISFYEINGETDENLYDFVADNAKVESGFTNNES